MARVCQVTGTRPLTGHKVSHSNIKTKRRFLPNLQKRRIWSEQLGRFVSVRVSRKGLKIIDKKGVEAALEQQD